MTTSDQHDDPRNAVTPSSEMTETELRLEREKLTLDREMLALERERFAAEREQWREEQEWQRQTSGTHVGIGVLGLAVATALVVGGLVGFNAGLEVGRQQAPLPRHVVVSRRFLNLLAATTPPAPPPAVSADATEGFDWFAMYKRPRGSGAAGNLPILR